MGKKRIQNTVTGHRRGSKYSEEVRTAALAMMMTSNNIRDVAKRLHDCAAKYNVPESTLRTWYKAAMRDMAVLDAQDGTAQNAGQDAALCTVSKGDNGAGVDADAKDAPGAPEEPSGSGPAKDWATARMEALRDITRKAAQGAMLTTQMMVQRAEISAFRAKSRDVIINDLLIIGPPVPGEAPDVDKMRQKLMFQLQLQEPMTDKALNSFTRTLWEIGASAAGDGQTATGYEEMLDAVRGEEF